MSAELTRENVKEVLFGEEKIFPWLRWALQLQDWDIDFEIYEYANPEDAKTLGSCTWDYDYRKATIKIWLPNHEDMDQVLNTLRHELLHLMHAPFSIYNLMVEENVPQACWDTLLVAHEHAIERTVGNLERMLDHGMHIGPRAMVATCRELETEDN